MNDSAHRYKLYFYLQMEEYKFGCGQYIFITAQRNEYFKREFHSNRYSRRNCRGCCRSMWIVPMEHRVTLSSVHDSVVHGPSARMVCADTGIQCMWDVQ